MFGLSFLFGDAPDLDFGFGSPYEEPEVVRTTITEADPGNESESTTTTAALVHFDDLADTIVAAGFPSIETEVSGSVVTVRGSVPDDASRRVVLERVLAVEGVTEVVDELVVQAGSTASSASIELARAGARVAGVVADQADIDRLVDLVTQFYLEDQINTDELVVDVSAAPLTSVSVTGTFADAALIEQIDDRWSSISSFRVQVDLELVDQPRIELELDELLARQPIEFNVGQATITPTASAVLDEVADILVQFPAARIEVGGHTDSQGGEATNRALSQERAETVVAELRARGVENDLLAFGYGELRPIATPEESAADEAGNRRIEFRLL